MATTLKQFLSRGNLDCPYAGRNFTFISPCRSCQYCIIKGSTGVFYTGRFGGICSIIDDNFDEIYVTPRVID